MPEIHPTAIVHPQARLADDVSIGAYSIIDEGVTLAAGCRIGPHVVIRGGTQIGKNNQIFQFASIGEDPQDKKYQGESTQLIIGDNNTIREFTTLNRGTVQGGGQTVIGNGNLIMATVHIAHDCIIGNDNIFANCAALAGHVTIHDHVILGGYSLIHQFCTIGNYAFTAMNSVISKDVPPYFMVAGHMAKSRGLNTEGLKRHGFDAETIRLLKRAYAVFKNSKYSFQQAITEIKALDPASQEIELLCYFLHNHNNRGIIA